MEWKVSYNKGSRLGNELEDFFNSDAGIGMIISTIFSFLFILLIVMIGVLIYRRSKMGMSGNNRMPTVIVQAKLIGKTENPAPRAINSFASMVFELEDGSRLEFMFPNLFKFGSLIVGDCGKLTYAGKSFIGFVPEK